MVTSIVWNPLNTKHAGGYLGIHLSFLDMLSTTRNINLLLIKIMCLSSIVICHHHAVPFSWLTEAHHPSFYPVWNASPITWPLDISTGLPLDHPLKFTSLLVVISKLLDIKYHFSTHHLFFCHFHYVLYFPGYHFFSEFKVSLSIMSSVSFAFIGPE